MNIRPFWIQKIEHAWTEKNVVWLQGVRRTGKTTLCRSFKGIELFDCELPRIQKLFEDPEAFFQSYRKTRIAIDEIHHLPNPSQVLKIAADYFKHIQVVATGSSTLHAKKKFSDTLTDRKRVVRLTPMNYPDYQIFRDQLSWMERLLKGGLPGFALTEGFSDRNYKDWIDSYFAKDIEELFSIDNKPAFKKLIELLALQSGGIFEASSFARPCGVSQPTIQKYLGILEQTDLAYVLKPYFQSSAKEVIAAPKVHFFDTGFISYYRGWNEIHDHEKGHLFENICVNEVFSHFDPDLVHYWRDKNQNEIDLVIKRRGKSPIAIECKWQAKHLDVRALRHFRAIHGPGPNLCVVTDLDRILIKKIDGLDVELVPYSNFLDRLEKF